MQKIGLLLLLLLRCSVRRCGAFSAAQRAPPPRYMLELWRSVAAEDGRTLTPTPYRANVVRCFADRDFEHQYRFFFNTSSNSSKRDKVLQAEFHLFKLKPRSKAKEKMRHLKSQLLEVRVHQVLPPTGERKGNGRRLLEVRRLSLHATGWEIFYIKEAVDDWILDESTNLGLVVTVKGLHDEVVPGGALRFAKQRHRRTSRHPLLVLFIDDGRPATKSFPHKNRYGSYALQDPHLLPPLLNTSNYATDMKTQYHNSDFLEQVARSKRDHQKASSTPSQSCTRHDLYVDFEKIGWSAWIISPKGYNAYHCKGDCAFPLDQDQWPTNHATVQSIVHELQLSSGVEKPCCVPNKLYSISLLYFDEHENVILKQYDDMVAAGCGCH